MLKAEIDLNALHANRFEVFGISGSRATVEEKAEAMRCFMERNGDEYRNDPDRRQIN